MTNNDYNRSIMESSREEEAAKYLEKHNIMDLMSSLTSMLLFYRAERPKEFLIEQLELFKTSKLQATDSPCLFDDSNLDSVFGILDPTNKGYISHAQYKEALKTLGIKNFNECPEGFENDRISHGTFNKEAKEGLLKYTTAFKM